MPVGNISVKLSAACRNAIQKTTNNASVACYEAQVLSANYFTGYGAVSKALGWNTPTFGFNGQRRSGEIGIDAQTAEFWEYNADIGHRSNIDPKQNFSFSPYSCFAGNPIWMTDVRGDTFDIASGSDKRAEAIETKLKARGKELGQWVNDADAKIAGYNADIDELKKKVGTKGYSQEQVDKKILDINKKITGQLSEKEDFSTKLQFINSSLTDISNMKTDKEHYIFESITESEGGTYRRVSDKAIIMKINSDENGVHELAHAAQIHAGKITGTGENTMIHSDLYGEEIEAYKRQYSLDPASVKNRAPSYPRDARNIKDITQNWLLGVNVNGNFIYLNIFFKRVVSEKEAKETLKTLNKN